MSTVSEVTDLTFQEKVLDSDKTVVVDFWASWCMPCRMMGPVFDETAALYNGNADFYKLNTDNSQSIAAKYGIMSIPSLLVFKGGEEVGRMIGVQTVDSLKAEIDKVRN